MLILILASLTVLSLTLTVWQRWEARQFPLHERGGNRAFTPPLTLLKPLKHGDAETPTCLRSWLAQDYPGPVQILFGVAEAQDPVCQTVRQLLAEYPDRDARLVICPGRLGLNAKVSTLAQLEPLATHGIWIVSDADVVVPPDFLRELVPALADPKVGLVNPLYRYATATTWPMRWEALSVNADFWSGVLQSRRLHPLRFALGAVMAVRRELVVRVGGFQSLVNHLADDFELGRRVAHQGREVRLCPVVAECREAPRGWATVWRHQVRWSRTIRVCKPIAYGLSLVSNATLWPLLWAAAAPSGISLGTLAVCFAVRLWTAGANQRDLTGSNHHWGWVWMALVKDLLQVALWGLAFLGNSVEWRGERFRVKPDGELVQLQPNAASAA